jgi:hypothetical protein
MVTRGKPKKKGFIPGRDPSKKAKSGKTCKKGSHVE